MHHQKNNFRTALFAIAVTLAIVAGISKLGAATLTVCASGCGYTDLQLAINAAVAGDTILVEAGATYSANYILRQKACAAGNDTCYITIRTGVTSTGTTIATSTYPAANIRIAPTQASLARIMATGNNAIPMRTVLPGETGSGCTVAPCVASYWKLQWLEFAPNSYAGNALLVLGNTDVDTGSGGLPGHDQQDNASEQPHHIIVDQVYMHGDPVDGQERAIQINARDVTIRNSVFADIKAVSDKAAIWTDNNTGELTLTNNDVGGGTENFIAGGDVPRMATTTTVLASPTPTTTTFTMATAAKDYLVVGQGLSVMVGGVKKYTHVTAIAGAALTVEALSAAPDVPGSVNYSVVPKNMTVTKNYFHKPVAWMNPILAQPQSVTGTGSDTGGTLAAGTYSYKVTAGRVVSGGQPVRSTASAEVSGTVTTSTGSVAISWAPVANAAFYYIYGRNAGGENIRQYTTSTSFTDTGTAVGGACSTTAVGTTICSQSVPTSTGSTWMMKNLFEIKKWHTATVEGNVFDYSWQSGQTGFCTLFTVLNNSTSPTAGGNDSAVVRDITVQNNKYRHCVAAFQITGIAADGNISDRAQNITLFNNIFEDLGTAWGAKENIIFIGTGSNAGYNGLNRAPVNVTVNHNTFLNAQGKSSPLFDLHKNGEQSECQNCDFTNNVLRRNDYGLRSNSPGLIAEGTVSWDAATDAASLWSSNVMTGATCSLYPGTPASLYCPSEATFQSAFADYAAGNYRITSLWLTASTTGGVVGADIDAIEAFTNIALSGNNAGGGGSPVPPSITTASLPNANKGTPYTVQLTATGGTAPYTWTVNAGSTLPTGLTLTTGGLLSGTPTVAGSNTFTIRATGADAAFSTQQYTMTIVELLAPTQRPDRVDWVEVGIFRRTVAPSQIDQVRVGDLWYDLTTGGLSKATATAPAIVWTPVTGDLSTLNASNLTAGTVPLGRLGLSGTPSTTTFLRGDNTWATPAGSSGAPAVQHATIFAGTATQTSNVPAGGAELIASSRNRIKLDVENSTQVAIRANLTVACAGTSPLLRLEYWDGAAWQASGATVACNSGLQEGSFGTLAAGARAQNMIFRIYLTDGDGVVDPTVSIVEAQFR